MILLNIALFCVTIFLWAFSIFMEKKLVNPLTVFLSIWIFIIVLSSLKLYGLQETNPYIYSIFLSGVIIFSFSYIFSNEIAYYNFKKKKIKYTKYRLRESLFQILGFIIIIKLILDLFNMIKNATFTLDLSTIKEAAQSSTLMTQNGNPILNSLNIFIFEPISLIFPVVVLIEFWNGNKKNILLIQMIAIIFLRIITTGARSSLTTLILTFVILYFFNNKKVKINPFVKIGTVVFLVSIFIFTTISRSNENTFQTLYYYFAMEPLMFEKWINLSANQIGKSIIMTSINGFLFPIFYLVKNIFMIPFPALFFDSYNITQLVDSNWQLIAKNGVTANAYVSMFFFLYYDLGIFGIIFGNIIYGVIMNKIYTNAKITLSKRSLALYVFLMIGLLNSFVRLQFVNVFHALAIIYLFLLYKKEDINE